jgi:polyhydroxyalkanoate synthesis regulator phasin
VSVRHETEDFVQLKDVIDDLIKQGKLNSYTNEEGGRSYENMKYDSFIRTPRRSESPRKKRSRKKKEN